MRKTALLSFAVIAFISHKHVTYVNALNYDVLRGSISTTKIHDSGHRRQLPEAYEGEPSHKEKSDGSDKQDKTDRNKVEYPSSSPSALPDKEDKLDRKKVEFPTSSPSVPPPPDWARPWNTASPTSLPPKWARPWNTASPTAMKTTNAPISTGTPSSNREVASTITPSFKSSPLLDPTSHVEPVLMISPTAIPTTISSMKELPTLTTVSKTPTPTLKPFPEPAAESPTMDPTLKPISIFLKPPTIVPSVISSPTLDPTSHVEPVLMISPTAIPTTMKELPTLTTVSKTPTPTLKPFPEPAAESPTMDPTLKPISIFLKTPTLFVDTTTPSLASEPSFSNSLKEASPFLLLAEELSERYVTDAKQPSSEPTKNFLVAENLKQIVSPSFLNKTSQPSIKPSEHATKLPSFRPSSEPTTDTTSDPTSFPSSKITNTPTTGHSDIVKPDEGESSIVARQKIQPVTFDILVDRVSRNTNVTKLNSLFTGLIDDFLNMRSDATWYASHPKSFSNMTIESILGRSVREVHMKDGDQSVLIQFIINGFVSVETKNGDSDIVTASVRTTSHNEKEADLNENGREASFTEFFDHNVLLYFSLWGADSLQVELGKVGLENPILKSVSVGERELIAFGVDKDDNYLYEGEHSLQDSTTQPIAGSVDGGIESSASPSIFDLLPATSIMILKGLILLF